MLIDTSDMSPHELRAELARWFAPEGKAPLAVTVQSFSYKRGLPRGLDIVLDCRFLRNPYWDETLRGADGRDGGGRPCARDPRFAAFRDKVAGIWCNLLLPAYARPGKAYLAIGFGCTGGQHRSVTVAETLPGPLRKIRLAGVYKASRTGAAGTHFRTRPHPARGRQYRRGRHTVIGIVIVAHGGLAREYVKAIEHVVGMQPGLRGDHHRERLRPVPETGRDLRRRRRRRYTGDGVVIVTDMFGGSPSNLSLKACRPEDRRISTAPTCRC